MAQDLFPTALGQWQARGFGNELVDTPTEIENARLIQSQGSRRDQGLGERSQIIEGVDGDRARRPSARRPADRVDVVPGTSVPNRNRRTCSRKHPGCASRGELLAAMRARSASRGWRSRLLSTQSRCDGLQEAPSHDAPLSHELDRSDRSRVPIDPRGLRGRRDTRVPAERHRRARLCVHREARADDEGRGSRALRARWRRPKSCRMGRPQGSPRGDPAVDQHLRRLPRGASARQRSKASGFSRRRFIRRSFEPATFARIGFGSVCGKSTHRE